MKEYVVLIILVIAGCSKDNDHYDVSGTFEADETIIPAEATGIIKEFTIHEGQTLEANYVAGYIDTVQLSLKKRQLEAQVKALLSKRPDVDLQLSALEQQLRHAESEERRITALHNADAATSKQLDDAVSQVMVLKKQINAQRSTLRITSAGLHEETAPLMIQIEQLNDQLKRSVIINPVAGTVLLKYANKNEMAVTGRPLYKIANINSMLLRAYLSGRQYPGVKLGQKVKIYINAGDVKKEYDGTVEWISSRAEFTPKTIQTEDERDNLVYAVKIRVKNDGLLKIGMYADVVL